MPKPFDLWINTQANKGEKLQRVQVHILKPTIKKVKKIELLR